MSTAFVALGSNLGDRAQHLRDAVEMLAATPGVTVERQTVPEETAPLGGLDQPPYLNAMVRLATSRSAGEVLAVCHAIEREGGRVRAAKWASRTLDLDLVCMTDTLCDRPELTLPHPGLRDRAFWARQLAELDSDG